jgi:hypothetical protein
MNGSVNGPANGAVTLQVWRVPVRDVAAAVVAGRAMLRRLRGRPDVSFVKVLGTASTAFVPTAATPRRWAALTCWRGEPEPLSPWWDDHADEHAALALRPLSSRGTWDGHAPFVVPEGAAPWDGPVVALTRSTLRLIRARRFYRAIPPVAAELRSAPGCRAAIGIGEAPVLRQGTVSVWDDSDSMTKFAYGSARHRAAVTATPSEGWYAEELFTRFALVGSTGSIDGRSL